MLLRGLPVTSRTVAALHGGQTQWSVTDHLIADIWALTVQVHTPREKGKPIEAIDHPTRQEMNFEAKKVSKKTLKQRFLHRKNALRGIRKGR